GRRGGQQNVFINRRIVRDRTIAHTTIDSYSQASIKERSPEVHLFIEMPADALDVNVHPTKAEVRFRDQSLVHEVVRRALMQTLGQSSAPQLQLRPEQVAQPQPSTITLPGVLAGGTYPNRWIPEPVRLKPDTTFESAEPVRLKPDTTDESAEPVRLKPDTTDESARSESYVASGFSRTSPSPTEIKPMIPLGQFRDTFIIAVDDEGVAIIDQHVAHERVLFERVMQRLTS